MYRKQKSIFGFCFLSTERREDEGRVINLITIGYTHLEEQDSCELEFRLSAEIYHYKHPTQYVSHKLFIIKNNNIHIKHTIASASLFYRYNIIM